ncbi:MAG TPA: heat-inducible transcriptional repressor HrcA [Candidatus Polarisedimenticolia bacterium]|nr:heat-inducible transcriptional repressor HrcA [Candidatus Polarisedimenticolia bacterium]
MKEIELDKRGQEILEAIVKSYVETGEPVGSRSISRLTREGLSAATVRNVMADLEDRNLLTQPHASAGRVPTDKAYRLYVDSLMKARRLPEAEQRAIESVLQGVPAEFNDLLSSVSRLLSRHSRHMGVVVSPRLSRLRVRDLEFVRLGPHRILLILVSASGAIHNKMVELAEDHEQEKLDKLGRYLTQEFSGHTLQEIRDQILERMGQEKALYDSLLRDALALGQASLSEEAAGTGREEDVFVDGTANLLSEPEFSSVERLKSLFRTFEEKHELLRMLNSCLEETAGGVRVLIGSENTSPGLSDCTLVASPYGAQGATLGTLGIIGPTRMEYARAIALVDSVARMLSHALTRYQG